MRSVNRSNALLVELLIVIAFFMLSSTVIAQLFSAAHTQSEDAQQLLKAQTDAQNVAELLYASDDTEKTLLDLGFSEEEGSWKLTLDDGIIEVENFSEEYSAGIMRSSQVRIIKNGKELISLPVARYEEVLQ